MRSLLVLVVVAGAVGCQCGDGISTPITEPIVITPSALHFPATFVQARSVEAISLQNPTRIAVLVSASTGAPFSVEPALTLEPGESRSLPVTFAPGAAGPHEGVLIIRDALGAEARLPLEGAGLDWLDCGAPAACELRHFDPQAGACVTEAAADETACTSSFACFSAAACHGGVCEGVLSTCEDGDRCTQDACGAEGCVHLPRLCEVTDPCQVAQCDPTLGCVSVPIEDGAACGPSSCAEAAICLGGACTVRARANATLDCHYAEVETGRFWRASVACAVTLGGQLKCWGDPRQHDWLEPEWAGAHSLVIGGRRQLCAVFPGGAVGCSAAVTSTSTRFGPPAWVPFSAAAEQLESDRFSLCARLVDGQVECLAPDGGIEPTLPAGPATDFVLFDGGACALLGDGGLRCATPVSAPPLRAVLNVGAEALGLDDLGAPFSFGGLGAALLPLDAGVVQIGGGQMNNGRALCLGDTTGLVRCVEREARTDVITSAWEDTLTPPLRQLTARASHFVDHGVLCAIDGQDEVWCQGGNLAGALGDRSVAPPGPLPLPRSTALAVTAFTSYSGALTWVAVDGGVLGFSTHFADVLDAGNPAWVPLPAGVVATALTLADDSALPVPDTLRVLDGDGHVWQQGQRLAVPEPIVAIAGNRALSATGHHWLLTRAGAARQRDAVAISSGCAALLDAGLSCVALNVPLRALSHDASQSSGCGIEPTGAVACWSVDGGITRPPGLLPFARQVDGRANSGCAVVGANGVQCWGALSLSDGGVHFLPVGEAVDSLSVYLGVACVRTVSGITRCWGDNVNGALGVAPLLVSRRFLKIPW